MMISVAMVGITVSVVSIRVGRVSMVGIRVGVVSMVSITISGVAITITIRSLSISRPLVVAVVGITVSVVGIIRIGMISMVSIAIGRVAITIRNSMVASISFSFGLSCD